MLGVLRVRTRTTGRRRVERRSMNKLAELDLDRQQHEDYLLKLLRKAYDILESEYPITDERHPDNWGLTKELINEQ
jgi:hypothetical protein